MSTEPSSTQKRFTARRTFTFIAGILLLAWLLIPTRDIVCPDWTVLVTDTSSHPLAGVSVTAFAQQYTLEKNDTEQSAATDANGTVHFHSRFVWANGLRRTLGVIENVSSQGPHASFGTHTHIHANKFGFGNPSELQLFAENERAETATGTKEQVSHISLMKCPDHYSGFGCDFPDNPSLPIKPLNTRAQR
jgi:hypothetical protein